MLSKELDALQSIGYPDLAHIADDDFLAVFILLDEFLNLNAGDEAQPPNMGPFVNGFNRAILIIDVRNVCFHLVLQPREDILRANFRRGDALRARSFDFIFYVNIC